MGTRVLIGAPVRQTPDILREFLRAISALDLEGLEATFLFIDDNVIEESSDLLRRFQTEHPRTMLHTSRSNDAYVCDDERHHWNEGLIWKVANHKNRIIAEALCKEYDLLFLVDSDLLLAPQLLRHLATLKKPVVSEVYWTSWEPNQPTLPQVWLRDTYTLYPKSRGELLSEHDVATRAAAFVKTLRRPGTYQVGGLGGCTLVTRDALATGLSFAEVDNLSFWGEDRHFCVRARALGIELWADTRYPPLHIYRNEDLARVEVYRARFASDYLAHPKLTLSMVVRNEANRWLSEALRAHRPFIHEAVIVDDASEDDTVELIRRELDGIPLRLVRNSTSRFSNEVELRQQQWQESLETQPDWLLILDADEILEPAATTVIPDIIRQTDYSLIGFPLYDFWSSTHYREDEWWCAHKSPRPFLLRYTPDLLYRWRETAQHCGRMPANVFELPSAALDLRIKHMGWADPKERKRKLARYQQLDPEARYGIAHQYRTIMDPCPNLVAWQDYAHDRTVLLQSGA
jgi:hypothetical protein